MSLLCHCSRCRVCFCFFIRRSKTHFPSNLSFGSIPFVFFAHAEHSHKNGLKSGDNSHSIFPPTLMMWAGILCNGQKTIKTKLMCGDRMGPSKSIYLSFITAYPALRVAGVPIPAIIRERRGTSRISLSLGQCTETNNHPHL